MGGGGLRILGHKKWHVWRRENIERVLRDEREHAEQQARQRDEARRVEQERRRDALLNDAGVGASASGEKATAHTPEHINFFQKEEEEHTMALLKGRHRTHVASGRGRGDRAAAQEETLGKQGRVPWYATERRADGQVEDVRSGDGEKKNAMMESRKEQKLKRALAVEDPLRNMRPPRDTDSEGDTRHVPAARDINRLRRHERKRARERLHEPAGDADHSRRRRTSDEKSAKRGKKSAAGKSDMLVELRRERDEREKAERARAERLLRGN